MMLMRRIGRIIIPLLMAVVIGFIANATLNQHYHLLSSGILIKHSHPFEKGNSGNPFQEHTHTTTEFFLLEQITNFALGISLLVILLASILTTGIKILFQELIFYIKSARYLPVNYRAPPFASF